MRSLRILMPKWGGGVHDVFRTLLAWPKSKLRHGWCPMWWHRTVRLLAWPKSKVCHGWCHMWWHRTVPSRTQCTGIGNIAGGYYGNRTHRLPLHSGACLPLSHAPEVSPNMLKLACNKLTSTQPLHSAKSVNRPWQTCTPKGSLGNKVNAGFNDTIRSSAATTIHMQKLMHTTGDAKRNPTSWQTTSREYYTTVINVPNVVPQLTKANLECRHNRLITWQAKAVVMDSSTANVVHAAFLTWRNNHNQPLDSRIHWSCQHIALIQVSTISCLRALSSLQNPDPTCFSF